LLVKQSDEGNGQIWTEAGFHEISFYLRSKKKSLPQEETAAPNVQNDSEVVEVSEAQTGPGGASGFDAESLLQLKKAMERMTTQVSLHNFHIFFKDFGRLLVFIEVNSFRI
jgi:hypothetical protein